MTRAPGDYRDIIACGAIMGLSPSAMRSMTLPEFLAAQSHHARANGKPEDAPSDAEFWDAVANTPSRPSILQ